MKNHFFLFFIVLTGFFWGEQGLGTSLSSQLNRLHSIFTSEIYCKADKANGSQKCDADLDGFFETEINGNTVIVRLKNSESTHVYTYLEKETNFKLLKKGKVRKKITWDFSSSIRTEENFLNGKSHKVFFSKRQAEACESGDQPSDRLMPFQQSCKSGMSEQALKSLFDKTISEARVCLSRPDVKSDITQSHLAKLQPFLNPLSGRHKLKIFCGDEENYVGFDPANTIADAYAYLHKPEMYIRPALWNAYVTNQQENEKYMKEVIFHELMHNCGHDHHFSEGVDRVYSCAKCCFEDSDGYDKKLACKICSQPAEILDSRDLSYFYRNISPRFGAQYSIAEFLRPDSKISDFSRLNFELPPDLADLNVVIEDKLLASGTIKKRSWNELNTTVQEREFLSPLVNSLFLAKSGNHEDAAKKLLEFSGNIANRHAGVTGVVVSLSRFILGQIDYNTSQSREIRQRFLSMYFEY